MSSFNKIIIGSAFLIALAFFGYSLFASDPRLVAAQDTGTQPIGTMPNTSPIIGQDIIDLVNTFKTVSIDPTFFSSPLFRNLKDFTVVLSPESQGRSNPFAPIGGDTSASSQTSSAAH